MKIKLVILSFIVVVVMFHDSDGQDVRIRLENCQLQKEELADIRNSLTYQLQFYSAIFNQPVDSSFKARIFGSEKEFLKYSKSKAKFNPIRNHSIAFYSPSLNEMILHLEVENFPRVFAHELSHAILSYYCKDAATWLDEGLAELLEDVVANDTTYYFGLTQLTKIASVQALLREGRSIKDPINTRNFYHESASSRNYRLSYAVVLYLFQTRGEMLANIVRSDCRQLRDMFEIYYPEGLDLLEVDVKSWFLNHQPTSD